MLVKEPSGRRYSAACTERKHVLLRPHPLPGTLTYLKNGSFTGASRGIGQAIAEAFAAESAHLVLTTEAGQEEELKKGKGRRWC
ncbi:hypothetical protein WJX82_007094 [Trebouxia sp. C0006]